MDVKYIPSIIKATEYEVNPIELRPDLDWSIIYESLKQVFEGN
nr:MAG TPA: Putative antitoxin of bacterial toxin-antitoxin system, YdaS/YdaT [Caudoviricetes sp.]